jgi:phosphate transport system permease protein
MKQNNKKEIGAFNNKKFRFSDWLAEKVIKTVAFLSIAVVILIFIFVFREAFPIFKMNKKEVVSTQTLVQESYGSTTPAPLVQESYGGVETGKNLIKSDSIQTEIQDKPNADAEKP